MKSSYSNYIVSLRLDGPFRVILFNYSPLSCGYSYLQTLHQLGIAQILHVSHFLMYTYEIMERQ